MVNSREKEKRPKTNEPSSTVNGAAHADKGESASSSGKPKAPPPTAPGKTKPTHLKKAPAHTSSGKPKASPAAAPGKAKPTPPAQHEKAMNNTSISSGPAEPGKAQPTPPAPPTVIHTATASPSASDTQGIMSRLEKIESMFGRMIPLMENLEHAESEYSRSYLHLDGPDPHDSVSVVGEYDESDSRAVIELADNRSVANFLAANQVQDHENDDAVSLLSGISQGQVGDSDKPEFKIPAMAQKVLRVRISKWHASICLTLPSLVFARLQK